jgi:hypothetical protein
LPPHINTFKWDFKYKCIRIASLSLTTSEIFEIVSAKAQTLNQARAYDRNQHFKSYLTYGRCRRCALPVELPILLSPSGRAEGTGSGKHGLFVQSFEATGQGTAQG